MRTVSDLFEQGQRRRLWLGIELGTQQVGADLVLAQCGRSFAAPHKTAHDQAVRILTAGITGQQPPEVFQTRLVIALLIVLFGQVRQQCQIARPQSLALDDNAPARWLVEIVAIQLRCAVKGCEGGGCIARLHLPMSNVNEVIEAGNVDADPGLHVEPVIAVLVQNRRGALQRRAEQLMQRVDQIVERLECENQITLRPERLGEALARYPPVELEREVRKERFTFPAGAYWDKLSSYQEAKIP